MALPQDVVLHAVITTAGAAIKKNKKQEPSVATDGSFLKGYRDREIVSSDCAGLFVRHFHAALEDDCHHAADRQPACRYYFRHGADR